MIENAIWFEAILKCFPDARIVTVVSPTNPWVETVKVFRGDRQVGQFDVSDWKFCNKQFKKLLNEIEAVLMANQ